MPASSVSLRCAMEVGNPAVAGPRTIGHGGQGAAGERGPADGVHADCAGIDIGKRGHYAVDELERMAAHLKSCGVRVVAMEETGVYWCARCAPTCASATDWLVQMNVLSDIMVQKTGQLIVRAIVAGGRDGGAGRVPGRALQGGRGDHRRESKRAYPRCQR